MNFEEYSKSEKSLLWQDFFTNLLCYISVTGCAVLVIYALWWFITTAMTYPVMFIYGGIVALLILFGICSWQSAKDRQKHRKIEIADAMRCQADMNDWADRLARMKEVNEDELDERQLKVHKNDIQFAEHQIEYYKGRRDEAMAEYRKHGGKKF